MLSLRYCHPLFVLLLYVSSNNQMHQNNNFWKFVWVDVTTISISFKFLFFIQKCRNCYLNVITFPPWSMVWMLCSASTTTRKLQVLAANTLSHRTLFNKETLDVSNYMDITPALNFADLTHSLIVGCGYQNTSLIPVVNGRVSSANCRRINMGGAQLDAFMQRLLQLKYPGHMAAITLSRAEVRLPAMFINWQKNTLTCSVKSSDFIKGQKCYLKWEHNHNLFSC